jgi:CubicO group peptidase (beta-lactamase class C family)
MRRAALWLACAGVAAGGARAAARPPSFTTGWFDESRPPTALRPGAPADVGLSPWFVGRMAADLRAGLQPNPKVPSYAGAVALAAKDGVVFFSRAVGDAVRFADGTWRELPATERVPMREDTLFDLASLSKLFTAVAALQLVDAGALDMSQPAARYLPAFGKNGKAGITVRQLLAHTSGLAASVKLWGGAARSRAERLQLIYDLAPHAAPGTRYVYSDLNMIVLQQIIERLSGRPLDAYVAAHITGPLGMADTGYNPPPERQARAAATEDEEVPHRGMLRGSVHDESAWALDGVSGNAGLFSTAHDLAIFAQMILNGGRYGAARVLAPATVLEMVSLQTRGVPDAHGRPAARGLGFELDAPYYMGALASQATVGHTGYTGTSLVIDLERRSFLILLSNAVHPVRLVRNVRRVRAQLATDLALADRRFLVRYLVGHGGLLIVGYGLFLCAAQLAFRRRRIIRRIGIIAWPMATILVAFAVLTAYGRLF